MNLDFRFGPRLDLSALLVRQNRCPNNLDMACCGIGWWSMNRLNKLSVCCIDGTLNYLLILSRSALRLTCHWYCCNSRRVVGLSSAVVLICSIDIIIFSKSQRLRCWLQLEDFYWTMLIHWHESWRYYNLELLCRGIAVPLKFAQELQPYFDIGQEWCRLD